MTASLHLVLLNEICERFFFVGGGTVRPFADFGGIATDSDVRTYLGALAP